ncbi:MAG: mercuric transporter MerT family protein [Bdellovibrionales bacterium]|nr:mercuric transporter MerT family protein [Bdellovibrionales bacterium]
MAKKDHIENKTGLFIGTGVIGAFLTALCCIGPLVLTVLGVSGAAVLAKFDVFRVPLIIIVVSIFGFAGYQVFKKRNTCDPDSICADPRKYKKMVIAYFVGLVLALAGIFSPQIVAWIY